MATPVFSDNALDECISRALAAGPTPTRAQQQRAWERVRQRAEQQVQLAADEAIAWEAPLRQFLQALIGVARALISSDEALQRAHTRHRGCQFALRGALHGGFAFAC
jgi:hypothetical protein